MKLLLVGCNYKTAPIELREKLAFDGPKLPAALHELESRYGCEAVILSTCNRVELYLARADGASLPDQGVIVEFLSEIHQVPVANLLPSPTWKEGPGAKPWGERPGVNLLPSPAWGDGPGANLLPSPPWGDGRG